MSERNLYSPRLPSSVLRDLRRTGYHSVYNIDIDERSDLYYAAMDKWCEENLDGKFYISGHESLFEYKEDMVKFGLTWI